MESRTDPVVGKVIDGRYRITGVIAEGGMGVVYRAEHTVIGRKVAIKILRAELAADDDVGERFLDEARTAGTLGHPNIVECTDFGSTNDDRPYLVMELLDGRDLSEELRRASPFPIRRVVAIARQIASALAAAHTKQIVHRDLKPENVFLVRGIDDDVDHVKILDFGISKFLNRTSGPKTQRGVTMGTPDFMAPEQLSDPERVDIRSDVHALGGLIYEMVAGRSPFGGGSYQQVVMRIMHQAPRPLDELRADVPAALSELITRCLDKDPDQRPQTMQQVIDALAPMRATTAIPVLADDDALARAPTGHSLPVLTPTGPRSLATPPAGVPQPTPTSSPQPSQPSLAVASPAPPPASNRGLLLVALLAVAALGLGVVMMVRGGQRPSLAPIPPAPPSVAASDAAPGPPSPPLSVRLEVSAAAPGATLTLRGQTFPLPFSADVERGSNQELIEIAAPGFEGRRMWVTLDRARYYDVALPAGAGMAEATDTELRKAADQGVRARSDRERRHQPIPEVTITSTGSGDRRGSGDGRGSAVVSAPPVDASVPVVVAPPVDAATRVEPPVLTGSGSGSGSAVTTGPRPGTVDVAAVRAVVRSHSGEVSGCYERARMENHSQPLRGKVVVNITVDATGHPTGTKVASSTVNSSKLESCVAASVRTWTFPAPAGSVGATFSYPFVFQ